MASSAHASPDAFNASYSGSINDSLKLLSSNSECGDINDIGKSSSILQNQNATESIHEPRGVDDE